LLIQARGQPLQRLFQLARAHPLLETAMAGLEWRILVRQLTPLRSSTKYPEHAVQHRPRIMPRATTIVRSPSPTQNRLDEQPLFIGQLPASGHQLVRGITQSNTRMNQFPPSKVYETGSSPLVPQRSFPVERAGISMSNTAVLITDMAILVGIFLLGLLAKIFPKRGRNTGQKR
jgi:hypothetical protein